MLSSGGICRICFVCLGVVASFRTLVCYAEQSVAPEYCQWEVFNASCRHNELILMRSAHYGRMKVGRCITANYEVGCSAEVLRHVDRVCSGKQQCVIRIPDPELSKLQPCRKDLVAYFEARYECIKVSTPNEHGANHHSEPVRLDASSGYIRVASPYLGYHRFYDARWLLRAPQGQRIDIAMYDFSSDEISSVIGTCPVHAVFIENGTNRRAELCGQTERMRRIYLSTSNQVQIRLVKQWSSNEHNLIFHYKHVGCADMEPIVNAVLTRTGHTTVIQCKASGERRHLVCRDTQWIGNVTNCSTVGENSYLSHDAKQPLPAGLIIAIIAGIIIGVIIGSAGLFLSAMCRRSFRRYSAPGRKDPVDNSPVMLLESNINRQMECRSSLTSERRPATDAPSSDQLEDHYSARGGNCSGQYNLYKYYNADNSRMEEVYRLMKFDDTRGMASVAPPVGNSTVQTTAAASHTGSWRSLPVVEVEKKSAFSENRARNGIASSMTEPLYCHGNAATVC